jgi:hypothetical protein
MDILDRLNDVWPADYKLQPNTADERKCVIEIQKLKKDSANEIQSLRKQLAVKDLEVMKLRDYIANINTDKYGKTIDAVQSQALSTTFAPEHLMVWYKEQLGEPHAWYYTNPDNGHKSSIDRYKWIGTHGWEETTLYAPKLGIK